MKIILTDRSTLAFNNDLLLDILNRFGEVLYFENIDKEHLLKICDDFDMILCNKTVIDREIMEKAKKLKYIGIFATGYNNIDIDSAHEFGITVCNAGSYSTSAVAQQVFAYILNHFCAIQKYDGYVKSGGWIASPTFSQLCFPTDELQNKKIGIIGYGSIGRKVAKIAKAFDMQVLVHTRTASDPDVNYVTLEELLQNSDIVTVHCPLNDRSYKMFNKETFSMMKKGSYFINTSRGGVVDEEALLCALTSGHLSGAAIDVLETEPMRKDCVLKDAPNITITPHTAWAPLTTRKRLLDIVINNISAFLSGKPENAV